MTSQQVWAFALASALLIVMPGLDMALVTRQALTHGRRAAFGTLGGLLTGGLTHASLATIGLSAVLLASATAYAVVKAVGAVFLLAVGVHMLWASRRGAAHPESDPVAGAPRRPMTARRAYLLGLTSNLTNPKVILFFLTFLPQFVSPGPSAALHTALLALLFNTMASVFWVPYVLLLGRVSGWLHRPAVRRAIERITGTVLVGLGLRLAVQR